MCNYEEVIAYNSKKEGLKLGYAKGSIDATANNVFNCMNSFNISLQDALKALNIDESIKDKVIEEVNKKTN